MHYPSTRFKRLDTRRDLAEYYEPVRRQNPRDPRIVLARLRRRGTGGTAFQRVQVMRLFQATWWHADEPA